MSHRLMLFDNSPIVSYGADSRGRPINRVEEPPSFAVLHYAFPGAAITSFSYDGIAYRWFIDPDPLLDPT